MRSYAMNASLNPLMKAIDISMYQRHPGESWWRRVFADGWELAIVGSWHGISANPDAERNLLEAKAAGFRIATYVALNAGSGRTAVRNGRQACGRAWHGLVFVAIDCETDGITAPIISEAIDEVKRDGLRPIIYTAHWWWNGHFGDPDGFRHMPLWSAAYDLDPTLALSPAYGGWTDAELVGKQYDGSTEDRHPMLHGVEVDKNTFDRNFVEEGDMGRIEELRAEVKQTRADLERVITAVGKEIVRRDDDLKKQIDTGIAHLDARVKALEGS